MFASLPTPTERMVAAMNASIAHETVDPAALSDQLTQGNAPLLVHVLPEDAFAEARIPGSLNFCVYESDFTDKIAAAVPGQATPIIVYGLSDETKEAETAVEKLATVGYTRVSRLAGGLNAWISSGGDCDGTRPTAPAPVSGQFILDAGQSVIAWTGCNLFNQHRGTLRLAAGNLELAGNALASASFVIDMGSIQCDDLADTMLNAMLLAHLKSNDFFAVHRFPTAEFIAVSTEAIEGSAPGTPNHLIHGDFTLRGVTLPLAIPAQIAHNSADGTLAAQAAFSFDRTRWGAVYGSHKFFARLGRHFVSDEVHLQLQLSFRP